MVPMLDIGAQRVRAFGAIAVALGALALAGACEDEAETGSVAPATVGSGGSAGAGGQGGSAGADPTAICTALDLPVLRFATGPFGTHRGELADDFTLPLIDGTDFTLSRDWSGCEIYL